MDISSNTLLFSFGTIAYSMAQSFMLVYHFRPAVSSFTPFLQNVSKQENPVSFSLYFTIPKYYFSYL